MTGGDGFVLGVDFGTSNTVAMLRRPDGRVTPLLFDGTPVLPSAVFAAPDGTLFVGRDALHHGRHRPDGLEPNPKRHIDDGTVLLSGVGCGVPDVIGAVLGRVADEATRVAGHRPETLVLSHPAGWGPVRRLTLSDAAAAAGLPRPVFVPEPVAAAMYFTSVLRGSVPAGAALLVYDLGAGTFDVTVLRAGTSFEVLGTDGLDDVGGLDVDAAVVTWLRDQYDDATWERLTSPATGADRRLRLDLWGEARVAKEMLSRTAAVLMRPPLLDQEIPLTLAEFERITQPLIDRTVRTAQGLARYCEVTAAQVLLVGGSSRIPLVATALHRAFGVAPTVTEQPETVVGEGCVFAPDVPAPNPPATALLQGDHDPVALSSVLPIGAGLTTEPFTGDFGPAPGAPPGPGALPAAPLGRSVLPAVPAGTPTVPAVQPAVPAGPAVPAAAPTVPVAPPVVLAAPPAVLAAPPAVPAGPPASPAAPPAGPPASPAAPSTVPAVAPAPTVPSQPGSPSARLRTGSVATLPASALPPGTIPEARTGEASAATGLLWPPLPSTIASHPLAASAESTVDTARLIPIAKGIAPDGWPSLEPLQNPATRADQPAEPGTTNGPPAGAAAPAHATAPAHAAAPAHTAAPAHAAAPTTLSVPAMPDTLPMPPAAPELRDSQTPAPTGPTPPTGSNGALASRAPAGPGAPAGRPVPRQARPDRTVSSERPAPVRSTRRGRARVAIALMGVVLLLAAAAVMLIVTVPAGRDRFGAKAPATSAAPGYPAWAVRYVDSLASQRGWSAAADPDEKVECAFRNGRLEIDMRKGGIFRCPGQRDELTDFALRMDVFLLDGQACAGIWFRRGAHEDGKDSSYVLKVCRTELVLGHHHANGDIAEFARFRIDEVGTGTRSRVGLVVRGGDISVYMYDAFVGGHHDTAFADGRLALGIAVPRDLGAGRVAFGNVELRTP